MRGWKHEFQANFNTNQAESSEGIMVKELVNGLKKTGTYKLVVDGAMQREEKEFVADGSQEVLTFNFDFSKTVLTDLEWTTL